LPTYRYPVALFAVYLFFFSTPNAFSQNREEPFNIPAPDQRISASLYNKISFIEARADTLNMGFVQLGFFNTKADIIFKRRFPEQLSSLMQGLCDSTAHDETIYFQLRKFFIAEQTKSLSESGTFRFRAALYRKRNDRFIKISEADTILLVKAADVTKSLLQHAGTEIVDFIQQNLRNPGKAPESYSIAELENPDSVEKTRILLYTTTQYTDGLYLSYNSFSAQIPDKSIVVEEKANKIKNVKVTDSTGKTIKIKSRETYAIVYKGQPYAATSYDFYKLSKEHDDFFFTGKVRADADPMAGALFGLMGALLSTTNYYTFLMKIDHHTGHFIRIRYIPDPG
jgi:hypothetical protein